MSQEATQPLEGEGCLTCGYVGATLDDIKRIVCRLERDVESINVGLAKLLSALAEDLEGNDSTISEDYEEDLEEDSEE